MTIQNRTSFVAIFVFVVIGLLYSQDAPKTNPERDHAFEVYHAGKFVDAMPLLEKLTTDNPKDVAALEAWGVSMLAYAQTLSDLGLRKTARAKAHTILVRAQTLGDNSDLLNTLLRGLPEDGSFSEYSDQKDVDEIMQQAEADFARGDLEKARQGYLRAHILNPKYYYAPLFIGDTYFKQQDRVRAGEWCEQATKIDPNVETAYRYWGDALLAQDKLDEARSKYIEAIIADPYNQNAWGGLNNWRGKTKTNLSWLKLQDGVSVAMKDGKTNVTMNSSVPPELGAAWLAYGMNHALWISEKFKKEFPNELAYRHSLKEETESLNMFLDVLSGEKDKPSQSAQADAGIQMLIRIKQAGLLEPFALLNRADKGLAQDYVAYRQSNREKIRQYLDEFVVPKTPTQVTPSDSPNGKQGESRSEVGWQHTKAPSALFT